MKQIVYKGYISEKRYGEHDDAVFIGESDMPLAEIFYEDLEEKQVSVRYWISDLMRTKQDLQEEFLKTLFGDVDANYMQRYSEITGYLWTDEELNIGGHDLIAEIRGNVGKYIYLEIDVHEK